MVNNNKNHHFHNQWCNVTEERESKNEQRKELCVHNCVSCLLVNNVNDKSNDNDIIQCMKYL
jgi:hypothetical protein